MTVAVIDSPHTFLEVTRLWEKASSLMTGEKAEEEAYRGLSYASLWPLALWSYDDDKSFFKHDRLSLSSVVFGF